MTRKLLFVICVLASIPFVMGLECQLLPPPDDGEDSCDDVMCDDGETCVDGECVADDPCADVTCDTGETCVDGVCIADDPCAEVTCDTGETCVDGVCVADDPCADVTCDVGETCVDGVCVADDPCADVTCDVGETCVDGACVPEVAEGCEGAGDAVVGEMFFADNGCAACHGQNAEGGFGPSLAGEECDSLFEVMSGVEAHTGGTVSGVTEADAADLAAWLATLQ